jgi:hypothetical protein
MSIDDTRKRVEALKQRFLGRAMTRSAPPAAPISPRHKLKADSPYYVVEQSGRWYIVSEAVKDDCPIVDDFATAKEAFDALRDIEQEREEFSGIEVPLSERGFGI